MPYDGHHFIAIFGGAVSGAESAHQLANRGFRVIVFDQNTLPYGKIEDGLPKWHEKLRDKEEQAIDSKLSLANVRYVPNVKLGEDIDFEDVAQNWGFTAVILATGAWKDRPLPIEDIDQYINKGLYYQNPFVYWFNHYHEPTFKGQQYEIHDNAMIIGGGLASLDVAKIFMIETVQKALAKRGHDVDMFTLDRSIQKVLDGLGLSLEDLGLNGCTLFYRRRAMDMPLYPMTVETEEQLVKAQAVQQKVLDNYKSKYLFKFEPCWTPIEKVVENNRLAGIVFQKTQIVGGRVIPMEGVKKEFRSPVIVSSIGSIPEKIKGVPAEGQIFKIADPDTCQIEGYENVFAVGNAVTGRGNIKESMQHGKEITSEVMHSYLNWEEEDYQKWLRKTEVTVEMNIQKIVDQLQHKQFMPTEVIKGIYDKTEALQRKVGYDGIYENWIKEKLPTRLEDMLDRKK